MDVIGRNINFYVQKYYIDKIVFFVAITISFTYLFLGFGCQSDLFYWIKLCENPAQSPMTYGTLLLGKVWSMIFTNKIISFRILTWIIELLTLYVSTCIIKTGGYKVSYIVLSVVILLLGYGWQNEYSPTTTTNLFILLQSLFLYKYILTDSYKNIVILSIITVFSVFFRFPNIVAIPFILLSIIFHNKNKTKYCLLYVLIFVVTYYLIMTIAYNTFTPWYDITNSIITSSNGSHNIRNLFLGYVWDFNIIFTYISIVSFFFAVSYLLYNINAKYIIVLCLSVLVSILFLFVFVRLIGFSKWNNAQLYYFIGCIVVVMFFLSGYFKFNEKDDITLIFLLCSLGLCLSSIAGSDTRYLKLYPVVLFFVPYLFDLLTDNKYYRQSFIFLMPTVVIFIGCTVACFWINPVNEFQPPRKYSLIHYNKISANSLASSIFVCDYENDLMKTIESDVKLHCNKYNGIAVGHCKWYVSYLSKGKIDIENNNIFFSDPVDDISFTSNFINYCTQPKNSEKVIFYCEDNDNALLLKELESYGYIKESETDLYKIFKKK